MISLHVNFKLKPAATLNGAHSTFCRLQRPAVGRVVACQGCEIEMASFQLPEGGGDG